MRDFEALLNLVFRANPEYELVLFDRLSAAEKEPLGGLRSDPEFYGVLRPQSGSALRNVKSVDRESALLFLSLTEPGSLPAYVGETLGAQTGPAIARLVADNVLEIWHDGNFASGTKALQAVEPKSQPPARGRLASLARQALRSATEFPSENSATLASQIYQYNRVPLTPRWQRLLSDAAAHARYLGLDPAGGASTALARSWVAQSRSAYWLSWSARASVTAPGNNGTYKLYVSPTLEALSYGGFAQIAAALGSTRAASFKIGGSAAALLRPDKIVAYFADFESLLEGAQSLVQRFGGMSVHGVPFTADAAADGLISWGLDPPRGNRNSGLTQSWRSWIAQRLAYFVVAARATRQDAWSYALERLALEGVDTETWAPATHVFEDV